MVTSWTGSHSVTSTLSHLTPIKRELHSKLYSAMCSQLIYNAFISFYLVWFRNRNCFWKDHLTTIIRYFQGSTKHFIPHGAITCSIQTDDIVACVLLLYNPATKCPLHVHAYRCDSEHTATALNEQLQILINRPENQKRFNELEARWVTTKSKSYNLWFIWYGYRWLSLTKNQEVSLALKH